MKSSIISIATCAILSAVCANAYSQGAPASNAPPPKHPLIGTWTWTDPHGSCAESYTYRPDGTAHETSGSEVADTTFRVSAGPSAKGFFKLTDTVVRDNGAKDCGGQVTNAPYAPEVTYVQIDQDGTKMIVCESEDLKKCYGPLTKQP